MHFLCLFCTLYSYVCELSCTLSSSLFCCLKRGFVWWELYYAARQLFHSIHAVIPMCLWWYRDYRITQWGLNSSQKVSILFDSHSQTIISLLDNAPNYLVGCVIQKRFYFLDFIPLCLFQKIHKWYLLSNFAFCICRQYEIEIYFYFLLCVKFHGHCYLLSNFMCKFYKSVF